MPASQIFLLDGHALCYRAFYAIRELTASNGQSTNAVYGFINILRKIVNTYHPDYLAVCFDSKEETLRKQKFAEYKIQRSAMPDNLVTQIPIIKDVIGAYNIPIFELGGYEADDLIATLARKLAGPSAEVVIVSEDKDLYQLANAHVHFFSSRQDSLTKEKDVRLKIGFAPEHMVDFIALAGDKVDNIPGVLGIGKVTAQNLINTYGSVEQIYAHLDDIKKDSVRKKLIEHKDMALLSWELALLDTEVPIEFDLESLKAKEPDIAQLYQMFQDLEFKRWAKEMQDQLPKEERADVAPVKVQKLADEAACRECASNIETLKQCALYMDAGDPEQLFDERRFLFFLGDDTVFAVDADQISIFKDVLENPDIRVITFNLKNMYKQLQSCGGLTIRGAFDVMLGAYLLNPTSSGVDLNDLAWFYFKENIPESERSAKETQIIGRLYPLLEAALKDKDLDSLLYTLEIPLSYALFRMESEGVCIDLDLLKTLSDQCAEKMEVLAVELFELAGETFNINSPKQLGHVLFDVLKLPVIKRTKTGFSTDEGVLTKLAESHDFPVKVLEYRQLAKLKSTYLDALPRLIDPVTGRIHTEFNQIGAETGRLSCRQPNLQNIPIRTELGRQIRKAFIPSMKDRILVAADYSQIELRILAHLSGDDALMEAFRKGEDIHNYTASLIFDVEQKDVTRDMRYATKRVNFGIVYGMGAFSLAKDLNVSQAEAQEFIDKYFMRYPGVKTFMDNEIKKCEELGYVLTLLNRRRYIPEIQNRNNAVRQFAQRQAINTPVQGSAADLMKLAMIDIQKALEQKKLDAKMLITVHDELVFDVAPKDKASLIECIRDRMEQAMPLSVPVKVTVKAGPNWLEMQNEVEG